MSQAPASPLEKLFSKHPREIGESYAEHAGHALSISVALLLAGMACLVHALIPGLFVRTASNTVERITSRMEQRSGKSAPTAQSPAVMVENPSS